MEVLNLGQGLRMYQCVWGRLGWGVFSLRTFIRLGFKRAFRWLFLSFPDTFSPRNTIEDRFLSHRNRSRRLSRDESAE